MAVFGIRFQRAVSHRLTARETEGNRLGYVV